jgi:hypothetical protein
MLFFNIVFTILLAFLVGGLFYYVFKYTGPWGSFWTFVIILVLAGIAASAWLPAGPVFYNLPWLPILFVVLMVALLIAAAGPARRRTTETNPTPAVQPQKIENKPAVVAISSLFWIFLILLIIAAITGIMR